MDGAGGAAGGAGDASLKRRWANVALSEMSLGAGGADGEGMGSDEAESEDGGAQVEEDGAGGDSEGAGRVGEDSMEMEMDGWNGLGERPAKRVVRTSLR